MERPIQAFWSMPVEEVLRHAETKPEGLTAEEVRTRQVYYSSSRINPRRDTHPLTILATLRSPITLILIFAAFVFFFLSDPTDAAIILTIILMSALLGFWQEDGAVKAVSALLALVHVTAEVWRDGHTIEVR